MLDPGGLDREQRKDADHADAHAAPEHGADASAAATAHHHGQAADAAIRGMCMAPTVWKPPPAGEWCTNPKGHKGDPINLYVHGDLKEIEAAFSAGGWSIAKPDNTSSSVNYVASAAGEEILHKPAQAAVGGVTKAWDWMSGHHDKAPHVPDPFKGHVDSMPVSDMYFKGAKQVVAFEQGNTPTGGRHHFRIFDTFEVDPEGRHVWAIAASRDKGIVFDKNKPQTGFTTHVVDPDTDSERDTVLKLLENAGHVTHLHLLAVKFGKRPDGTTSHGAYDVVEGADGKPKHK